MSFYEQTDKLDNQIILDFAAILWRKKKVIVLAFIASVIGIYSVLLMLPDKYESTALLMVNLGRENTEIPVTVTNGSVFATGVKKEEINSYISLLKSRNIIVETINEIGLEKFSFQPSQPKTFFQKIKYKIKNVVRSAKRQFRSALIMIGLKKKLSTMEKAVITLERSLKVAHERDSDVIRISVRLPDPVLANQTVSTLVDIFRNRHVRMREDTNVLLAFKGQAASYEKQLVEMQKRIKKIKDRWNIADADQQRKELISRKSDIEQSLREKISLQQSLIGRHIISKRNTENGVEKSSQSEVPEQKQNIAKILDQITQLKIKRTQVLKQYDPGSQVVKYIDEEISDMQNLLSKGLSASISQDHKNIAALEKELSNLDKGSDVLNLTNLDYQVLKKKYLANAERLEHIKIDNSLNSLSITNVVVLASPTASEKPVSPNRMLLMIVGSVASLIISIGLVLVKESLGSTIYSRKDIARSGEVPFLLDYSYGKMKVTNYALLDDT